MNATDQTETNGASRCSRCGAMFACGAQAGAATCWCAALPAIAPQADLSGCLCPTCLEAAIDAREAAPERAGRA